MSDQAISYPTEAMKQTAKEIRALLDEQWAKHIALFKTNHGSLMNITTSLTRGVPHDKSEDLHNQFEQWGKGISQCYQSLYALADALDSAADGMTTTDLDIKNAFSGE